MSAEASDAAWEGLPLPAAEIDPHGVVRRANQAFRSLARDAGEGADDAPGSDA